MNVKEIINSQSEVTHLEIDAPSLDHATVIATDWCEENNCLLKKLEKKGQIFLAEVCSDDYN